VLRSVVFVLIVFILFKKVNKCLNVVICKDYRWVRNNAHELMFEHAPLHVD
jgi:hypothetical protein